MSVLINDVADYLAEEGIGTVATDIFCGYLPDETADCIAVLDTGGSEPDKDIPTKEPTFQVMIRASDYSAGKAQLDAVRAALHRSANISLVSGETYFYFILAIAEGGHLGRDDGGRDLFSINFRARTR